MLRRHVPHLTSRPSLLGDEGPSDSAVIRQITAPRRHHVPVDLNTSPSLPSGSLGGTSSSLRSRRDLGAGGNRAERAVPADRRRAFASSRVGGRRRRRAGRATCSGSGQRRRGPAGGAAGSRAARRRPAARRTGGAYSPLSTRTCRAGPGRAGFIRWGRRACGCGKAGWTRLSLQGREVVGGGEEDHVHGAGVVCLFVWGGGGGGTVGDGQRPPHPAAGASCSAPAYTTCANPPPASSTTSQRALAGPLRYNIATQCEGPRAAHQEQRRHGITLWSQENAPPTVTRRSGALRSRAGRHLPANRPRDSVGRKAAAAPAALVERQHVQPGRGAGIGERPTKQRGNGYLSQQCATSASLNISRVRSF
jgi:hypothetical protein